MRKIETKRLILREFDEKDLDALYAFGSSKNVGPMAGWAPYESKKEAKAMLRAFRMTTEVWAIALRENDEFIGNIGLYFDEKRSVDDVRMLGYALREEFWGNGFAGEAAEAVIAYGFDKMKLDLISAYVYPENERSKRLLEKLGFAFEGRMRLASTKWNGEVTDDLCYSIVRIP